MWSSEPRPGQVGRHADHHADAGSHFLPTALTQADLYGFFSDGWAKCGALLVRPDAFNRGGFFVPDGR
jgi:hypothetical protein